VAEDEIQVLCLILISVLVAVIAGVGLGCQPVLIVIFPSSFGLLFFGRSHLVLQALSPEAPCIGYLVVVRNLCEIVSIATHD